MKRLSLSLLAALVCSGCFAGAAFVHRDVAWGPTDLYSDTKTSEQVTNNEKVPPKRGEACASNVLGIITTGDASAGKAARNAGITRIASVDNSFLQFLGLYAKYCVIVTGD